MRGVAGHQAGHREIPAQKFITTGIKPMARPSLVTRFFMHVVDDAYEHEAWNFTSQTRVVLFVDLRKPLHFPANLINWLLLHPAMFTPFIREGHDNQDAWEKKFYREAETLRNAAKPRDPRT